MSNTDMMGLNQKYDSTSHKLFTERRLTNPKFGLIEW